MWDRKERNRNEERKGDSGRKNKDDLRGEDGS